MEWSLSWQGNNFLVNQQTLHILSNLNFHHVCNSLPHVPVLSQINPIHVCHPISWRQFLCYRTLICLGLPNGLSVPVSQTKAVLISFPHVCYIRLISHHLFDFSNNILWRVGIMNLLITQSSSFLCYLFLLAPHIILSTLISNTLSLCSSLLVRPGFTPI